MGLFRRDRQPEQREQRDPTAATKSLRWVNAGRAQAPDWNASTAYTVAYYMDPAAYAAVRAIAETISGIPFRAGPIPGDLEQANPNARLAKMLGSNPPDGPCPGLGASDLWFAAVRDYLVTGRFGWEIETAPGGDTIAALWPLTAAFLKPIPTQSGARWFSGFEYGRPGDEKRLTADRVFYAWRPHGLDFRQPESALEAAGLSISVSVMQAKEDYAFLRNGSRPATVVVTEEFEDEDSYRAFQSQWDARYQGPDNGGRTAFLEATGGDAKGAVSVTPVGISPRDADAAKRSAARQREIAMALGVPWSRLDASGRTFDNAAQEDQIFWRQTLVPLLTRLQNAVNVQLAPRLGAEYGWFDLSDVEVLNPKPAPPAADPIAPEPADAKRVAVHVHTAEVREVTPPSSPLEDPDPPAPSEPEDRGETAEEAEARRSKIWAANDSTVRNLERAWEKAIVRLFKRQERSVLARLDAKRGRQQYARATQGEVRALADEVFDPQHWIVETVDDARVLYEQVTATAGAAMASRFGLAFDLDAAHVAEFIEARANQLAGLVTETTYTQIQDALVEGITEGEAIPDLAARIRHVFEVASKSRAVTIARTEVISAYNGAGTAVAAAYGPDVVGGREWVATRDSRTRDTHAARDGEVVTMTETFSGGLAYPGDPSAPAGETVNCRCTVAYLTPDEMHERAARSVKVDVARAVIALVRPGEFDERWVRSALRRAA
jgi:HK97 family phage portal protein